MEIKVLIPGTIPERGLLEMLFNPDIIPDNVYVDMHGGLMPAKKFFRECHDALSGGALGKEEGKTFLC